MPQDRSPVHSTVSWLLYGALMVGVAALALTGPDGSLAEYPPVPLDPPRNERKPAPGPNRGETPESPARSDSAAESGMPLDAAAMLPDPDSMFDDATAEGGPGSGAKVVREQAPDISLAEIEYITEGPRWITHEVVPLETVEQIAHRYAVRPDALRMWNALGSGAEDLRNGARLRVKTGRVSPPRQLFEYVVQPADTWWKIGTRYGVDSADLRYHNWDAGQRLRVGQSIRMWIDPVVYQWIRYGGEDGGDAVRRGAVSIGPPQDGRLVNGVSLPGSPYYRLELPPSSYGTTHAVTQVREAIVRFRARSGYGRPLVLGSMSGKHGGPLTGHVSHQTGRDLDIRLPLEEKVPEWFAVEPRRVDWVALWHLVTAFVETGEVMIIFFDYDLQKRLHEAAVSIGATEEELLRILQWPRGHKAHRGRVRHASGHEAHIHIRFTCGRYEPECVPQGRPDSDGG